MKKWMVKGICIGSMLTLFLSGCATPPEEPTDQIEQVEPALFDIDPNDSDALIAGGKKARELAIVAGAEQYFPDELLVVDIVAREAQVVYEEGGDSVVFNGIAFDTVYQYMALEQASLSSVNRQRIDELGFESYNPEQYAVGMEAALQIEALFSSGAMGRDLYEQSKKSADAYMLVLKAGFIVLGETERDEFLEAQKNADAIKSGVADKEGYTNAVAFFTQADANLLEDDPESAYNNFIIGTDKIIEVYEGVSIKRVAAEEAIARAKYRTEVADEIAAKADTRAPLVDVEALDATDTVQEGE